jgi:hypothetical protein
MKTNFQFGVRLLAPGFWTVYTARAIYVGKTGSGVKPTRHPGV